MPGQARAPRLQPLTASHVFGAVGARLQVDAELLAYLFCECFEAVASEAVETGGCTLRGLGRITVEKKVCGPEAFLFVRAKYKSPKNSLMPLGQMLAKSQ